ncbi:MAG: hypothetical protein Q7S73_02095 [bacterium]|nr:hypothetical protein [bacterium]
MLSPIATTIELIAVFLIVNLAMWILPYKLFFYLSLSLYVGRRLWLTNGTSWKTLKKNLGLSPKDSVIDRLPVIVISVFFGRIITLIAEIYNPDFLANFFSFIQNNFPVNFALFAGNLLGYSIWALFQQIILNGYFGNQINSVINKRFISALITGLLFAITHLPNPVLMPVTFFGGTLCSYFFLNPNKQLRNVYLLALLHAILGLTVSYSLPNDWHHNMRVGPGYYTYEKQNR